MDARNKSHTANSKPMLKPPLLTYPPACAPARTAGFAVANVCAIRSGPMASMEARAGGRELQGLPFLIAAGPNNTAIGVVTSSAGERAAQGLSGCCASA